MAHRLVVQKHAHRAVEPIAVERDVGHPRDGADVGNRRPVSVVREVLNERAPVDGRSARQPQRASRPSLVALEGTVNDLSLIHI